ASRCEGNGGCALQQQGCLCDDGFTGATCHFLACANGQPNDVESGGCLCTASFYGDRCERWTCNTDSFLTSDGVCACSGYWAPDAAGNCTSTTCDVGFAPPPGDPFSCVAI